jgi:proline dehydrogenase
LERPRDLVCCPLSIRTSVANSLSGTYQSYLTRQPQHLLGAIRHAEVNGYALGVKLVRGAYLVQERKKWADEGRPGADPIWPK